MSLEEAGKSLLKVSKDLEKAVTGLEKAATIPSRAAPRGAGIGIGQRLVGAFQSIGRSLKPVSGVSKSEWKAGEKFMDAAADAAEESKEAGDGAGAAAAVGTSLLDILIKLFQPIIDLFKPFTILFDIFSAALAEALLPAITELMQVLLSPQVIDAIVALARLFAAALIPTIEWLTATVQRLIDEGFFSELVTLFNKLATDIDWSFLIPVFTAFLNKIIELTEDINWEDFFDKIVALIPQVVQFIEVLSDLFDFISNVFAFFAQGGLIGFLTRLARGEQPPQAQGGAFVRRTGAVIVHDQERILSAEATRAMGLEEGGTGMGQRPPINIIINGITDIPAVSRKIRDELEMIQV